MRAPYHPWAMDHRTRKSPARFLAPLALIAFVIVFFSVLSSPGGDGEKASGSKKGATTTTDRSETSTTKTTRATKPARKKPKTYTIQAGDTLGTIAEKTGVSLTTIQELNPDVDSTALTTGQKIKLEE